MQKGIKIFELASQVSKICKAVPNQPLMNVLFGDKSVLNPAIGRIRDLTYSAPIHVDLEYAWKGRLNIKNDVFLGKYKRIF